MKQIPQKIWSDYVKKLSLIDKTAAAKVKVYLAKHGIPETIEASRALIAYSNSLIVKYGEASAALSCEMYDAIALAEGAAVPAAVPAALPEYDMVAKAINGTVKYSNIELISGAVERLVKLPSADTMLQNAIRDQAEFAWIPSGDTCMFCLALAANGWVPASKKVLRGDHAEHVHAHCDCTFAIRHDSSTKVGGYDPQKYMNMVNEAAEKQGIMEKGDTVESRFEGLGMNMNNEVINAMRREAYAENKEIINAQKRSAYAKRKELNSSKAEELKVN